MRVEEQVFSQLSSLGVSAAFGVPGSQNVGYYDAIDRSAINLTTTTHELSAGFAAVAFGRVARRPAVLLTIPGPGMTDSISALAEALHDSVPLIMVTQRASSKDGPRYQLQALDEKALLAPVVKSVVELGSVEQVSGAVATAYSRATTGAPGPVVLIVDKGLGHQKAELQQIAASEDPGSSTESLLQLAERISNSRKILFFVSHAADSVSAELKRLADATGASVMATPGARGVFDELLPGYLATDERDPELINSILSTYDLIVSFGVKYSHSNTFGFELSMPPDRLVHVSSDPLPAEDLHSSAHIVFDPAAAISFLAQRFTDSQGRPSERAKTDKVPLSQLLEPTVIGTRSGTVCAFFQELRTILPSESILVTDTGNHQTFARRHFSVGRPAGLLTPAEFQFMGFGLPAALGAKCAEPDTPVVLIIGDGGLQVSGMELATLTKLELGIPIFVFCNGRFESIHQQQTQRFGRTVGTDLPVVRLDSLAAAFGLSYDKLDNNLAEVLSNSLGRCVPTIIEVELVDSPAIKSQARKSAVKGVIRKLVPDSLLRR